MWKLTHRVILKEIFSFFILCVAIFLSLLLIGRFIRLGSTLISLELSLIDILKLTLFLSPFILFFLLPIACMLSVFLTFQRMESDREILVLKSGGVSMYQLLPSPVVFLIFCCVIHMFISFYFMPIGIKRFQRSILDMVKTRTKISIKPGFFNTQIPGLVIYVQNVDRNDDVLKNVIIKKTRTKKEPSLFIIAPQGRIKSDYSQGKILFFLSDGVIYNINPNDWSIIKFGSYSISLDLSNILKKIDLRRDKSELFSWSEINNILKNPEKYSSQFYRKMRVERCKRISLPFACIVLGLFAITLAWIFHGIKRHLGVILMIFMFFVYYGIFSLSLNMGKLGYINPFGSAWLPNLLFLFLTGCLLILVRRVR